MSLIPVEYDPLIYGMVCETADVNGGLGEDYMPLPNGMLDGAYELGLIAGVLNDSGFSLPNGLTNALAVNAFENNYALIANAIVSSEFGPYIEALAPGMTVYASTLLAGYITEGDDVTFGTIAMVFDLLDQLGVKPPDLEDLERLPYYFGPEGDADNDGCTNRQEYDEYQPLGAKIYVANALNPLIHPEGCGQGEFEFVELPQGEWLEVGDCLELNVAVSGTVGEVSYQWVRDGLILLGGTSSTYTVDPVTACDEGWYSVRVQDQSKGARATPPVQILVFPEGGLPVAGVVGLILSIAGVCASALIIPRRRKSGSSD